jgi:hypothetical protein
MLPAARQVYHVIAETAFALDGRPTSEAENATNSKVNRQKKACPLLLTILSAQECREKVLGFLALVSSFCNLDGKSRMISGITSHEPDSSLWQISSPPRVSSDFRLRHNAGPQLVVGGFYLL